MMRFAVILFSIIILLFSSFSLAQNEEKPLKIFGYFQNSFQNWTEFEDRPAQNSFSLQQLNLFMQKNIGQNWTAFINYEFLNNYSSFRQWGSSNLEEAWVKYRLNEKFSLKLGLQIPQFNNLNEIKNRTPLLPYIVRPLVYETSFSDFIPIEEFVPARSFVQMYGFLPMKKLKLDYAVYAGNSSNINNNRFIGQTGIDTTSTFLVGGRLGLRYQELKLGLSATYEKKNDFMYLADTLGRKPSELKGLPKTRLGGDLSYNYSNLSFESEFIMVDVDEGIPELELDLDFYYATLGYFFADNLFIYGSYWVMDVHSVLLARGNEEKEDADIITTNIGISYNLNDRIRIKGQFARVENNVESLNITRKEVTKEQDKFSVTAVAVSIFF